MQETEKNKLNLVGFLHIFLISIYSYLENHFPFECFLNIKARNFHQHFTSMTEAKQCTLTEWDQPIFKEVSLLQLKVLVQNCNERKSNLYILLRDASKRWASWCLDSEPDASKECGGLFGTLNVCHGSFSIKLEKMILYKVISLQTLSHLGCDFYIKANIQGPVKHLCIPVFCLWHVRQWAYWEGTLWTGQGCTDTLQLQSSGFERYLPASRTFYARIYNCVVLGTL